MPTKDERIHAFLRAKKLAADPKSPSIYRNIHKPHTDKIVALIDARTPEDANDGDFHDVALGLAATRAELFNDLSGLSGADLLSFAHTGVIPLSASIPPRRPPTKPRGGR